MAFEEWEIEKEINRLSNLKSHKDKSQSELRSRAIDGLTDRNKETEVDNLFTNKTEVRLGRELFDKYSADYTIETVSDKNTLREIIYLEVIQRRLQEKLNEYYEKNEKALPLQLVDTIHKNSKAIIELKDTLGLNRSKEKKSGYDVLDHMKKRFKKWGEENQASRTATCPHCAKPILFRIRTESWELQKHPFFKDKILYNTHLVKLFLTKQINKFDVAAILECSEDYIDWLISKWHSNTKAEQDVRTNT